MWSLLVLTCSVAAARAFCVLLYRHWPGLRILSAGDVSGLFSWFGTVARLYTIQGRGGGVRVRYLKKPPETRHTELRSSVNVEVADLGSRP